MGIRHEPETGPAASGTNPAVILIPGLGGSGPGHWQTIWEQQLPECSKVDLGNWENPHRNTWINKLNLAIYRANRPVVLAAHSLGCMVAAWWARFEQRRWAHPVIGALMVAPPEVDFFPLDERLTRFSPTPAQALPFPSRLIASRDDPWISFHTAQTLAKRWGSTFVDAGDAGHLNADSGLGDWSFGREQLAQLLRSRHEPVAVETPLSVPAITVAAQDRASGLVGG
jgi:predicted alpha/beta hydrolase family esterase